MKLNTFAGRVSQAMVRRGLTLRALCRAADLDPSFFSKVLTGKRSPPWDEAVLRRLAEVLELDSIELIILAGRLPSEWRVLWENPRLLSQARSLLSRWESPGSQPVLSEPRVLKRQEISEELL